MKIKTLLLWVSCFFFYCIKILCLSWLSHQLQIALRIQKWNYNILLNSFMRRTEQSNSGKFSFFENFKNIWMKVCYTWHTDSDMAITLCIVGCHIKNSIDLHRNNSLKNLNNIQILTQYVGNIDYIIPRWTQYCPRLTKRRFSSFQEG